MRGSEPGMRESFCLSLPKKSIGEAEPEPRSVVSLVEPFTEGQGLLTCLTSGTEKELMAGAGGVITHKPGAG